MSAYAFGSDASPSDPFFDSEGGVTGTTTESSRAANAVAHHTEERKQFNVRDGYSGVDEGGIDDKNHGFGLDLERF